MASLTLILIHHESSQTGRRRRRPPPVSLRSPGTASTPLTPSNRALPSTLVFSWAILGSSGLCILKSH
eukprot:3555329-Pleurochrysis_carterae.AAC.2